MPPVCNNCCLVEGNFAVKVSSLLVQPLESAEELPYNNLTIVLYFFQPLNVEQYDMICNISNELRSYSPDVRILTTYYCGPSGSELAPSTFEAFVKVPNVLRPHTQIFCTR